MAEYRPPGVYAQEEILTVAPSPIANEDIVALVSTVPASAPNVESIVLSDDEDGNPVPVALSRKGVVPDSIRVLSRDETIEYNATEDFTVARSEATNYVATTTLSRVTNSVLDEEFSFDSGRNNYQPDNPRGVHNIVVKDDTITYTRYEDYTYDRYANVLKAVRGGRLWDSTDTYRLSYDYGVADGEPVLVRYQYADANYYAPRIFDDPTDIYAAYGPSWSEEVSNGVTTVKENPMSLAAGLVFSNGGPGTQIMTFPVNPHAIDPNKTLASLAEWEYSFDSINQDEISLIVETSGLLDQQGLLITSVLGASTYQQSRIGVIGRDQTKESFTKENLRSYARAINNQRVVLMSPPKVLVQDTVTNTAREVGSQYAAAALAGRLTLYNKQDTMTRKSVVGVRTESQESEATLTSDTAAGLCVIENKAGFMKVRHSVTTAFSDVNQRELSVVRAKDFVIKSMRYALDGSVIGMLMTPDVDFLIQGAATNVLDRMLQDYVITGYQSPQVSQDSSDPTSMRLKFAYTPNYPVNEIIIEFSVSPLGTSIIQ